MRIALARGDHAAAAGYAPTRCSSCPITGPSDTSSTGTFFTERNEPAAAVEAYARAYELAPGTATVLKLAAAERRHGIETRRLLDWLDAHPEDADVRVTVAAIGQAGGRPDAAIEHYEYLVAAGDPGFAVLNNLAWLYQGAGDPRALETAARAYEVAPDNASVADTYGWILSQNGRHEQSLRVLEHAVALAPDNAESALPPGVGARGCGRCAGGLGGARTPARRSRGVPVAEQTPWALLEELRR